MALFRHRDSPSKNPSGSVRQVKGVAEESHSRFRFRIGVALFLLTPLGFATKGYHGPAARWVSDSFGGVLYEIFWCLVIAFFRPKTRPLSIALWVFFGTSVLEVLQLWHPPFLELIRSHFIGRTLIGESFCWSDFPYYAFGSLLGALCLGWLGSPSRRE